MRAILIGMQWPIIKSLTDLAIARILPAIAADHGDAPCTPAEAVERALAMARLGAGEYGLGTGDYRPSGGTSTRPAVDLPWTGPRNASDCAGFAICWCWKLRRHRPGFNRGAWATVADDLNCNSAIEDARHKRELFAEVAYDEAQPGDLITYPTIRIGLKVFIGHVGLITWAPEHMTGHDLYKLQLVQCHGPNGFRPGAVTSDGSVFQHHDANWPKPQHRCAILRPHTRG